MMDSLIRLIDSLAALANRAADYCEAKRKHTYRVPSRPTVDDMASATYRKADETCPTMTN